ncbi:zinc finger BED domain-containing protein 4-like [Scomber scombrus]|uniref:zinc finger BED domain-containing protein 4-like n=1 Tax=Scomber scombrus TaxID=13677 RepID=UPI002DDA30F5|nr:zinc finger BED domain-containing protein 4-like [Scomber scombrus]
MLQKEVDKVTHSDSTTETPGTEEPQEKKPHTGSGGQSLLDMHDEILEENSTMQQLAGLTSKTSVQVHGYLSEPPIPRNESPLQYWKSNMSRFPALAKAARKYLSAPCTSVDSERLFSAASHVVDEKRNRIQCEKAEMLLFVKKNLPLLVK